MGVYNVDEIAWNKLYIVVRFVNNEAWYYDSWYELNLALKQAQEIEGYVYRVQDCHAL